MELDTGPDDEPAPDDEEPRELPDVPKEELAVDDELPKLEGALAEELPSLEEVPPKLLLPFEVDEDARDADADVPEVPTEVAEADVMAPPDDDELVVAAPPSVSPVGGATHATSDSRMRGFSGNARLSTEPPGKLGLRKHGTSSAQKLEPRPPTIPYMHASHLISWLAASVAAAQ